MGRFSNSDHWQDVIPVPQDDGGPHPLAAIAYTEEYSEAMSYLRALMANDEKSERALELTRDIIGMNPAHYTVWYELGCGTRHGQKADVLRIGSIERIAFSL